MAPDSQPPDTIMSPVDRGELRTFADVYESYLSSVAAYMRRALQHDQLAEDATHEVFLRVYEALPAYRPGASPFAAWLFRIARNCAIDYQRREGHSEPVESRLLERLIEARPPIVSNRTASSDWISQPELRERIDHLPRVQRQVVVLRYLLDCSHAETARILGRSEVAVRQSHFKALRFLQTGAEEILDSPDRRPRRPKAMRTLRMPRRVAYSGFSLLTPPLARVAWR